MSKPLFPIELNEGNKKLRDFLISKFGKYVEISKSEILEVGIGNGRFGILLGNKFSKYYGIDIDEEYVKISKTNIPKNSKMAYKLGSAEKIPFKKKFDIVFYAQSWHFIKNFDKALVEAERVLKEEGIIVILEPSEKSENWASPKLRKDSPEFDKNMFLRKIDNLKKARKEIESQKLFEIKEHLSDNKSHFYILKRK